MTPEMAFECLFVSDDPSVFRTMERILHAFSIRTTVCPNPLKAAMLWAEGNTDLVVIDFEHKQSSELMHYVYESRLRQKPTILGIAADGGTPGVHVTLRRPVTPSSGSVALRAAYSRMLRNYRKHTRFAVGASVLATDESNRTLKLNVTNIGDGGVLLTTTDKPAIGAVFFLRVPLPESASEIYIQARVLWTRRHGEVGCEFVGIFPKDLQVLREWLESRYQFKRPFALV